ncbi:hypothetical protein [Dendronalium sp. ChiSLP03b]|uniref:hypothetical protein n=1 Tax=Dendronalium sp. ChiSLP03b TaxID=3075381 RepID=UPI002AD1D180|nr:hypothetical protein [Dendronalium sp. ChiSLP03b]MDZ8207419.1 hypothetical protein [Dendronalium sp. ChiSLP03b]
MGEDSRFAVLSQPTGSGATALGGSADLKQVASRTATASPRPRVLFAQYFGLVELMA